MSFLNQREAIIRGREKFAAAEEENNPLTAEEQQIFKKSRGQESLPLGDFSDVYSKSEIQKDQEWLKRQQTRANEFSHTSRSQIIEYAVSQQAEAANWLGEDCYTFRTTEYDDRVNHVDLIIEWPDQNGKASRLAVDVTSAENPAVINRKDQLIHNEIESGKLATVKYFKSEIDDTKGAIENLPRVVLAVGRDGIQKLCQDLITKKPAELAKSPEQLFLLKQIQIQMTEQIEYALKLLMEKLDQNFARFKDPELKEIKELARVASDLEANPDILPEVLNLLAKQKNILGYIRNFPFIQKYIDVIGQQEKILNIANQLIKEKSGQLDKSVVQQAADQEERNIVIQQTHTRIKDFHLPTHLRELALAA